jgi:adenylosuccinate lyase
MLVGTGVSAVEMEAEAMAFLELPYFPIATQVYSRKQDFQILNVLADLGASLHKFAMDFRIMQSPAFGELSEPFGKSQTGSSAMPFKQNPIISENICSLTRYIAGLPAVAWDNASQSILERTLDDSANRRIILPEAFLAIEQCLMQAEGLITGMTVDKDAVQRNLDRFGQISALERVFTALVSVGADRQNAHQWLRDASIAAGDSTMGDQASPLKERLLSNKDIAGYLSEEQIEALLSSDSYTGTAETRALDLVKRIRYRIGSHSPG